VTPTTFVTQLISVSADGLSAGNGDSYNPSISPDGRYVAFVSLATNLVSNISPDGITPQVYLRDTCSGLTGTTCSGTTYLISTSDGMIPGDGESSNPSVALNGLFVSFTSLAANLGSTAPNRNPPIPEIYERSTCLTNICTANTTLISTPDEQTLADGASSESSISNTGRFIAFASTASNLVIGAGPTQQIYLRDTCIAITTGCTPSTSLVSITTAGVPGNGTSEFPSISETGQYVAFASLSSNFASTTNGVENIFVRNTCVMSTTIIGTECTVSTVLVTQGAGTPTTPSNGNSLVPSISPDGTTVSFLSFANNLVPRDNNGLEDIFLGSTTFQAATTEFTLRNALRSAEARRSAQSPE
jgi:Tol biopolymer transport system component